jgi:phospholipid/cholesterol/gamma-HCH transport system substrate-binding protein
LQSLRHSLEDDQLLHKTTRLVENLEESVSHFNADGADALRYLSQAGRNIASGTGTVGRLINSEDFYLRLASVMGKVETLMNDINHYGILFQYDKSWQRSRTKRANILKSLETPGEFKAYFEGEVDTIQTAVGRLGELMDRAGKSTEREKIFQSEAFKRDFGSLLRQVESLAGSIRLYNEGLNTNPLGK